MLPVRDCRRQHPEANVPHVDLKWWLLAQFDSALVSSADGTTAAWYKRDPEMFRDLMTRSVALHARLATEWPTLVETYKDGAARARVAEDVGRDVRGVHGREALTRRLPALAADARRGAA